MGISLYIVSLLAPLAIGWFAGSFYDAKSSDDREYKAYLEGRIDALEELSIKMEEDADE